MSDPTQEPRENLLAHLRGKRSYAESVKREAEHYLATGFEPQFRDAYEGDIEEADEIIAWTTLGIESAAALAAAQTRVAELEEECAQWDGNAEYYQRLLVDMEIAASFASRLNRDEGETHAEYITRIVTAAQADAAAARELLRSIIDGESVSVMDSYTAWRMPVVNRATVDAIHAYLDTPAPATQGARSNNGE